MKLHFENHKLCNAYSVKLRPVIASPLKRYNKGSNHGMSLSQTGKPACAGRTSKPCGSRIAFGCYCWSPGNLDEVFTPREGSVHTESECLALEPLKNCTLCSWLWSEGLGGRKATRIEHSWARLGHCFSFCLSKKLIMGFFKNQAALQRPWCCIKRYRN